MISIHGYVAARFGEKAAAGTAASVVIVAIVAHLGCWRG